MSTPPFRPFSNQPRLGVSELYAAVLMIGVTLSIGSVVIAGAANEFGIAADSATLGASLQQATAEVQISLVYSAVPPSGSCPTYGGFGEGTSITVALFDYGTAGFDPGGFLINSTAHVGTYASVGAGTMAEYVIPLGTCAHSSGQTILAFDSAGDEVQLET
jgi:hypothetical protein